MFFSPLQQPLLAGVDRLRPAQQHHHVAFFQAGFGRRFDGADAAAADGAGFAAQGIEAQFGQTGADRAALWLGALLALAAAGVSARRSGRRVTTA